ncbi:MAG: phage integrase SAM-like domain and Arm DNA-binding domain-containing protein, partial [Bacteroidota bacterium]
MRASFEIQKGKANAEGECPVRLVIWHADRRARLALGVTVKPRHWNPKAQEVRKGAPRASEINANLRQIAERARSEADRLALTPGRVITATAVRDAVRESLQGAPLPSSGPTFLSYCDAQVEGYRQRAQLGTWESYRAQVGKLRAFAASQVEAMHLSSSDLPFESVTPDVVRAFYGWLLAPKTEGGQGNRLNTARKAITTLRTFWDRAAQDGLAA